MYTHWSFDLYTEPFRFYILNLFGVCPLGCAATLAVKRLQSVATLGKVHSFDDQSPTVCAPQQESVCVCVRERESEEHREGQQQREREGERKGQKKKAAVGVDASEGPQLRRAISHGVNPAARASERERERGLLSHTGILRS